DRRSHRVPERPALFPQHGAHGDRLAPGAAVRSGVRRGDLGTGSRAGVPRSLAALACRLGDPARDRLRTDALPSRHHDAAQHAGASRMVTRGGGLRVPWQSAVLLAIAVTTGAAPPYDGSKPMQCSISTVMVCSDPAVCVRGNAATVNLPPVINVDVGQKVISGAATGRTIKITSSEREAGRLLLS